MTKSSKSPQPDLFGFSESSVAALADTDLLSLFSTVGATVAKRFLVKRDALSSWSLVLDYLRSAIGFSSVEHFRVLYLDKRNVLIADEHTATGTVDHVGVYPREIAKRALELNASALILVHNHPSGDASPSQADIAMTKRIRDGLEIFGMTLHDHVIVARDTHSSFRSLRLL